LDFGFMLKQLYFQKNEGDKKLGISRYGGAKVATKIKTKLELVLKERRDRQRIL
jgi:hypothetical protein